jgi:hypothetical protein
MCLSNKELSGESIVSATSSEHYIEKCILNRFDGHFKSLSGAYIPFYILRR